MELHTVKVTVPAIILHLAPDMYGQICWTVVKEKEGEVWETSQASFTVEGALKAAQSELNKE